MAKGEKKGADMLKEGKIIDYTRERERGKQEMYTFREVMEEERNTTENRGSERERVWRQSGQCDASCDWAVSSLTLTHTHQFWVLD